MQPIHFPNTFFAYLDLLGFAQFVLNLNTISEFQSNPLKKQKQLLDYYNVLQPMVMGPVYGSPKVKNESDVASIAKNHTPRLNSYIVSDSIFLWTDDISYQSFITLLDVVKHLIMMNMTWSSGFPVRGGIAMGSITFQHNDFESSKLNIMTTLVGDALVKAAALEAVQNWAGCVVDDEIVIHFQSQFPNRNIAQELQIRQLLIRYPVPVKSTSNSSEKFALIWPSHYEMGKQDIYNLPIKETFERNGLISDRKIKDKFENTIHFVHDLFSVFAY